MEAVNEEAERFDEYLASERDGILKDILELHPKTEKEAKVLNRAYTYIKYFSK